MSHSEAAVDVRHFLHRRRFGILSTHSQSNPGYPFGSVVPYCLDEFQNPIIFISDIAEHTKNIFADKHVSLTVTDSEQTEQQAHGRATLLAQAEKVEKAINLEELYFRYFPSATSYRQSHGFYLFRLQIEKIRYIGGFGKIFWLTPEHYKTKNPFGSEQSVLLDDISRIFDRELQKLATIKLNKKIQSVALCAIDSEGMDINGDNWPVRINFNSTVKSKEQALNAVKEIIDQS